MWLHQLGGCEEQLNKQEIDEDEAGDVMMETLAWRCWDSRRLHKYEPRASGCASQPRKLNLRSAYSTWTFLTAGDNLSCRLLSCETDSGSFPYFTDREGNATSVEVFWIAIAVTRGGSG